MRTPVRAVVLFSFNISKTRRVPMSIRLFCATSLIACSNVSTIVGQPKKGLRVRTKLRAAGLLEDHNETNVGQPKKGPRVNTNLRAGGITLGNHHETIVGQPKK